MLKNRYRTLCRTQMDFQSAPNGSNTTYSGHKLIQPAALDHKNPPNIYMDARRAFPYAFFHATNTFEKFSAIITSGQIKVMHNGAYKGAFVSCQHVKSYGDFVFILSKKLVNHSFLHANSLDASGDYWAGFAKDIPLNKYLTAVAYTGMDTHIKNSSLLKAQLPINPVVIKDYERLIDYRLNRYKNDYSWNFN